MKIKVRITSDRNAKYYRIKAGDTIEIDLQDYLCGVVASQVGNAHIEACKAQAVASRTMAYPYYSIGKTISDSSSSAQCFNAQRLDGNKYPNAFSAVQQTEGQLIWYGGKVIQPASFSANNGGRTVSSKQRWGGDRSWLIAKDDPWDQGNKTGHGVGMSQRGAKYAAEHGKTYRQILSFYYTGTTVGLTGKECISMAQVTYDRFIQKANAIWEKHKYCTYKNSASGQCSNGTYYCDCRGYIMWTLRELGINISCIGTNWMIRNQMTNVDKVTSASQLKPGMVVFKSRTDTSKLPDKYRKGNAAYNSRFGEIDVYHVGIVIQVSPILIIRHCSSGGILTDTKLGKWNWAGWVKWVQVPEGKITTQESSVGGKCTVTTSGGPLNLRKRPTTSSVYIMRIPNGAVLDINGQDGDWYKVKYGGISGYVSKQYVTVS